MMSPGLFSLGPTLPPQAEISLTEKAPLAGSRFIFCTGSIGSEPGRVRLESSW